MALASRLAERMISGAPPRLGDQKLDTPLADLDRGQDGCAWVRLTAPDATQTELWVD